MQWELAAWHHQIAWLWWAVAAVYVQPHTAVNLSIAIHKGSLKTQVGLMTLESVPDLPLAAWSSPHEFAPLSYGCAGVRPPQQRLY